MAVAKTKKKLSHGIARVAAKDSNPRITIKEQSGAVLAWATEAGAGNFKGTKKSPPHDVVARLATKGR